VWQVIQEELGDALQIVAVALDTAGRAAVEAKARPEDPAARPEVLRRIRGWSDAQWRRQAVPEYPCLIDEEHVVADLYGMTNVPMAVWIDEAGRIVRPAEPAGVTDHFRRMDPDTFGIPDDDAALLEANRLRYLDALRDWVQRGAESEHALAPEQVRARMRRPEERDVRAALHLRVARRLHGRGEVEAAKQHVREAVRLCPEKWNYRRQAMVLDPELVGEIDVSAEYYEGVEALGEDRFYPQIDMAGIQDTPTWVERGDGEG
jgi:hypothetical protein